MRTSRRRPRALADRLPARLAPFARIAYNYRWSWDPEAVDLFQAIDPQRWELCNGNPVRLLTETSARRRCSGPRTTPP